MMTERSKFRFVGVDCA